MINVCAAQALAFGTPARGNAVCAAAAAARETAVTIGAHRLTLMLIGICCLAAIAAVIVVCIYNSRKKGNDQ